MWSANAAITLLPSLTDAAVSITLKDFLAPISDCVSMPSIFLVNNDLPVNESRSPIDHLSPGQSRKALLRHRGGGTPPHVAGELFCPSRGHQEWSTTPYRRRQYRPVPGRRGSRSASRTPAARMRWLRDGRVRGIASSLKRSPNAPRPADID